MSSTSANYVRNLFRLLHRDRLLAPLVVSYCVTTHCNLNCVYCEDFGARRNAKQSAPLPLPKAKQLLSIIRQATDSLIFTGGEPLLYPDFESLAAHARSRLRFRSLTLLTNGTLLPEHADVLRYLTRLVISLDSVDAQIWDRTIGAASGTAQAIINTIASIAQPGNTRLVIHCVLTPETLKQAQAVLDFCIGHGILFSCSPQSVNNWPTYPLLVSDAYRALIARLIELKKKGAPILGSLPYLRLVMNWQTFPCHPLLAPRVMPDGTLSFPCRPIERSDNTRGGRIGLLEIGDWATAVRRANDLYGEPPMTCGSCYQQCYVEPSLMQAQPFQLLHELVAFRPSRQASLPTYAPG